MTGTIRCGGRPVVLEDYFAEFQRAAMFWRGDGDWLEEDLSELVVHNVVDGEKTKVA